MIYILHIGIGGIRFEDRRYHSTTCREAFSYKGQDLSSFHGDYHYGKHTDLVIFLFQHTPLEKLDRKHFAKGSRGPQQNGNSVTIQPSADAKEIALIESKVKRLCDLLQEVS